MSQKPGGSMAHQASKPLKFSKGLGKLANVEASAKSSKLGVNLERLVREVPDGQDDQRIAVIIRVAEPSYVPNTVSIRERIDPFLISADVSIKSLRRLADDNGVISVSSTRVEPITGHARKSSRSPRDER